MGSKQNMESKLYILSLYSRKIIGSLKGLLFHVEPRFKAISLLTLLGVLLVVCSSFSKIITRESNLPNSSNSDNRSTFTAKAIVHYAVPDIAKSKLIDIEKKSLAAPDSIISSPWVITDAGESTVCDNNSCLLYTSPSPRDQRGSRMPSSA